VRGRRSGNRGRVRGSLTHADGDGDGEAGKEDDGVGVGVGVGSLVGVGVGSLLGSGLITGGGLVLLCRVGDVECPVTGATGAEVVRWKIEPDGRALLLCSRARVVADVRRFAELALVVGCACAGAVIEESCDRVAAWGDTA
jgi:hypothetical protein